MKKPLSPKLSRRHLIAGAAAAPLIGGSQAGPMSRATAPRSATPTIDPVVEMARACLALHRESERPNRRYGDVETVLFDKSRRLQLSKAQQRAPPEARILQDIRGRLDFLWRARRPGCRFVEILVLVGPQGSRKSRAVYILAIRASWFSDQELLHLSAQQQQEALDGVWIYELSELGGLGKASVERVKAFASRRSDRARRAYGKFREDVKRMCVFIATTNDDLFLRDPTGNRRFWPVNIGRVRLKQLRTDVHQLWAEAAHLEASGYKTTLPKRLWKGAERAQNRRMDGWLHWQNLKEKCAAKRCEFPTLRSSRSSASRRRWLPR